MIFTRQSQLIVFCDVKSVWPNGYATHAMGENFNTKQTPWHSEYVSSLKYFQTTEKISLDML